MTKHQFALLFWIACLTLGLEIGVALRTDPLQAQNDLLREQNTLLRAQIGEVRKPLQSGEPFNDPICGNVVPGVHR